VFTPSHSLALLTLLGVCDVTPELPLGPHPCNAFTLTPGLPFDSHPCKSFALVASPRLGLRQLLSLPPNAQNSSQMQSRDKKYDGHVLCKVITTKIKNSFRLNFKKVRCLSHLHCVHDDYEKIVCFGFHNEIFYCGKCVHIPVIG